MPVAKPCIGYSSRSAACRALKAQGLTYKQISEKTGIQPETVGALLAASKRPKISVNIGFTEAEYNDLWGMAEREGWTITREIKERCFGI